MEPLSTIPQPLYKYRVWHEKNTDIQLSRRILTENEIYFASADQFNDPFDCSLPYRYTKESLTPDNIYLKLAHIAKEKFPNASDEFIHNYCYAVQSKKVLEGENYWREFYPYFKEQINSTFGIFCATAKRDSLLMWSHYADSHYGFCLGLDKLLLFQSCVCQIGPVIYDDEFPQITLNGDSTHSVIKLTMTKSKQWSYENEYRMVSYGGKKVVKIPNEAIVEIILGSRMLSAHKEAIYETAKDKYPNARIYETQINDEKFKLDFIPIICT